MIRKILHDDKTEYIKMAEDFYSSPAVLSPVPKSHFEITFDELMKGSAFTEGFIFECDEKIAGYGLIAKTFSQEAGGVSVTVEEIYVEEEYRNKGIGTQFFEYMKENIPAARYRIEVEADNEKAMRLYERMGFEVLPYIQMVIDKQNKENREKEQGNP